MTTWNDDMKEWKKEKAKKMQMVSLEEVTKLSHSKGKRTYKPTVLDCLLT